MVNLLKLKSAMAAEGKTSSDMAAICGISPTSWFNKTMGRSDFTVSEANDIKSALKLTAQQMEDIFFTEKRE